MAETDSEIGEFSAEAIKLFELLRSHTPFAAAIVRRQCERCGLAPRHLTADDLAKVGPLVVAAAAVFVDPTVLAQLRSALSARK